MTDETKAPASSNGEGAEPKSVRVHALVPLFVWALVIVLVLRLWNGISFVFLMLLASTCAAAALRPLRPKKLPGPRWVAGTMVGVLFVLALAGGLVGVGWLIISVLQNESHQWTEVRDTVDQALRQLSDRVGLADSITFNGIVDIVKEWLLSAQGGSALKNLTSAILTTAVALALFAFGTIYLLGQPPRDLTGPLGSVMSVRRRAQLDRAIEHLEPRLRGWLIGTAVAMSLIGIANWIGFTIIGLRFATTLALIAAVSAVIPMLGPIIAFAIALLVASTQGTSTFIAVAVLCLAVQFLETQVVTPLVMRRSVCVPPIVTLFTLVLWGYVFGPLGLLLAIPIDLVIWTAIESFVRPDVGKEYA